MKNQSIKTDLLKQASVMDLVVCALSKVLSKERGNKKLHNPNGIGKYRLVSKISKANDFKNFAMAIYKDEKGKKVFVKTWRGKTKNFPYYSLINEYNMAKALSKKISKASKGEFRIPKPIGYLKTQNSLTVISQYVKGKPLSDFSIKKQSKVIVKIISLFTNLTPKLDENDKKYIKKRNRLFYLLSLPIIFLYSFLFEKEDKKIIFYSFLKTYLYAFSVLRNKEYSLAHGDLHPNNIIVSESAIYILDLEHMKYTFSDYDLNYLSIGKKNTNMFLGIIKNRKNFFQNAFLRLYIAMQFSTIVDPKTHQRTYFNYLKN